MVLELIWKKQIHCILAFPGVWRIHAVETQMLWYHRYEQSCVHAFRYHKSNCVLPKHVSEPIVTVANDNTLPRRRREIYFVLEELCSVQSLAPAIAVTEDYDESTCRL